MTAQFHEALIVNGEKTSMAFCPPIPVNHPRIVSVSHEEAAKHPFVFSTACWRHYIGTWEIKDELFYLVQINGIYKVVGSDPILADWFSGILRIPRGAQLQYVHMGFGSVYEEELHIKIETGVVVKQRIIDNRGKDVNAAALGFENLPGLENRFPGDDDF